MRGRGGLLRVSGLTLTDVGELHLMTGDLLHWSAQFGHQTEILFVRRSDEERQQISHRIDRQMDLRAFISLALS